MTFRYFACSPPGRFATSLHVSPPDDKVLAVLLTANFETGGETSTEVAKRPGIEIFKGVKRPPQMANRPGSESSKRNVQVANWQGSETSMKAGCQ